jgi:uncharacterized peroxidase-related enzyme
MSYLPSVPDDAPLLEVFRAYPDTAGLLLDYHQMVMRAPSPFTQAERELIAAYVSGLNACRYCHGIHRVTAEAFGIPEGTVTALLDDVDTAPVEERMKPVLRYVGKLTLTPSRITPSDAEAVFAAGWDERALYDAVSVCALFNLMNRLADGLGVTVGDDYLNTAGRRLADIGYTGLKNLL